MLDVLKQWTPNNKRFLAAGLALTITAQMLVLATEYLSSVWPLWFGTPITLQTQPIDPRSLFRGNYVRLSYGISSLEAATATEPLREGEVGYVTLVKEGDHYVASGLRKDKPASGLFIRGRVDYGGDAYRMKYGIEAYFLPRERALRAEKWVGQGAVAEVYVLDSGKAAIAGLTCGAESC